MVSVNEYKTLDIKLDKVNSYIPPIVVNEADNNGRRLKFTPTYEGQPIKGITSARMYYDPRPRDAASIGDYVDGTKDGDGWVFVIPPNTFTANVQGVASVSFTDADGETYTRSMPIDVESGGTKIDSQGTRIDRLIATLEQMVNDFTMTADTETGPAGSQASVNVTRLENGSYKLDFTIPTGAQGPKGDPGDLTTVAHDSTLTGDGTGANPLGAAIGSALNQGETGDLPEVDYNTYVFPGLYAIAGKNSKNAPSTEVSELVRGALLVSGCGFATREGAILQVLFLRNGSRQDLGIYMRGLRSGTWDEWRRFAPMDDIRNVVAHDSTLTGDGTGANPLGAAIGSALNQGETGDLPEVDYNTYVFPGLYAIAADNSKNAPSTEVSEFVRGALLVSGCGFATREGVILQVLFLRNGSRQDLGIYMRGLRSGTWDEWRRFAPMDDIRNVSALTSRIAALESKLNTFAAEQTRLQALEARIKSLETN